MKYIAIGVDGHQHGLGECEDFIIAAQIVRDFIDDEVVAILRKLINEKELQQGIAEYVMPKMYKIFPWTCRMIIKLSFAFRVRKLVCVATLQQEIVKYLNKMIKNPP